MTRLRLLNLDDFENIYIGHINGAFDYEELKRRHAEQAKEKLDRALSCSGLPTEQQQEAIGRLLKGRGR